MEYVAVIILAAVVFGLCFLVDKGFTRIFRNQQQHHSGLSVRLSKRYGSIGLILVVLGLSGIFAGLKQGWVMIVGGSIVILTGICLVVHYMSFGVFYDEESFLVTTFGRRSTAYRYGQIRAQQLYNASGNIVVELFMDDGRSVQLHTGMSGMYPFMDKAFAKWLEQTGKTREDCPFYDPENSCWFPPAEG